MTPDAVRAWLARHTELEPVLLEGRGVDRLVDEGLARLGRPDVDGYLDALPDAPQEVEQLITGIAVPESWLFRYPRSFEVLARDLASRRERADGAAHRLRMLSVACARGEEPCSMAVTALHAGWPGARFSIDAIDQNRELIAAARAGRFGRYAARHEIPAWARPWVVTADAGPRIAHEALATIEYRHGDALTSGAPGRGGPYDVVFCRNLLIYLNAPARAKLVNRIAGWLAPGGLLFVGHAEPHGLFDHRFVPVDAPHAFALRRAEAGARSNSVAAAPVGTDHRGEAQRSGPPVSHGRPARPGRSAPRAPTSPPAPPAPAPRAALAGARALADRGRLAEALRAAENVLAIAGPEVETLALLGDVQLALGRLADARDSFRRAVYLDPEHEPSLLQLALVSERLGAAGQAEQYRRRAERAHRRRALEDEASRGR